MHMFLYDVGNSVLKCCETAIKALSFNGSRGEVKAFYII